MSVQYGWKAIFKASVLILREYEEQLLDMSFEMMLSQMPHLQMKFLIASMDKDTSESPEAAVTFKQEEVKLLDKQLNSLVIPTILLERLKREFDESETLN